MNRQFASAKSVDLMAELKNPSSSEVLPPGKGKRIASFKALSTERNSVMEHLHHFSDLQRSKPTNSGLFQSERWTHKGLGERKPCSQAEESCGTSEENPFLRTKMAILTRDKATSNESASIASLEDDDIAPHHGITTFRILKKGSCNVELTHKQ